MRYLSRTGFGRIVERKNVLLLIAINSFSFGPDFFFVSLITIATAIIMSTIAKCFEQ